MKVNNYELDQFQMDAIISNHDATVVIAGAGSGKTLTIQGKIQYLINELHYNPESILCISFTNKSVDDLKRKIEYPIDIYTFHKLAIKLINGNYQIAKQNYLEYIITEYLESYIKNNRKTKMKLLCYLKNKGITQDNLISSLAYYIRLVKSYNKSINDIFSKYQKSLFNSFIYKMLIDIYIIYENELKSTNTLDYDDLLTYAKNNIKNDKLPYKYIIIDEFQDTSVVRFNLILEIIKYTNAKLMVVGDDYQSIYKFNGCDLNIFLNIKNYIEDTKYIKLKNIYRFSNELIYISCSFMSKNKKQITKELYSNKHNMKPIKIIHNTDFILNTDNYLVITRNNQELNDIDYPNKMTIHASKGLEADNVIIYNSDNIPSKVKTHTIFYDILEKDKNILYEEERRLFYVALTRTKNNVYIMINKKISPFVKELIHDFKNYIEFIN